MKARSISNAALETPTKLALSKSEKRERQNKATRNLFLFSLLILILPLGTKIIFNLSLGTFFLSNKILGSVWAGVAAVLMANFVLVGYVFLAMLEEADTHNNNINNRYVVYEDRDGMAEEFLKEKLQ